MRAVIDNGSFHGREPRFVFDHRAFDVGEPGRILRCGRLNRADAGVRGRELPAVDGIRGAGGDAAASDASQGAVTVGARYADLRAARSRADREVAVCTAGLLDTVWPLNALIVIPT